jgi:hypothetical protein
MEPYKLNYKLHYARALHYHSYPFSLFITGHLLSARALKLGHHVCTKRSFRRTLVVRHRHNSAVNATVAVGQYTTHHLSTSNETLKNAYSNVLPITSAK